MTDSFDYGFSYYFARSFTLEVSSALISGLNLRFKPGGDPIILKRLKDDAQAGKLTLNADGQVDRGEVVRWLAANGLSSEFKFDLETADTGCLDPDELPDELDAANIVFRAYQKRISKSPHTAKQWIANYLEKHFAHFNPEQRKRIAIVANPDKSTGRKPSRKE